VKVYVVITVFQGVFDAIAIYKTEEEADAYVEKLKAEYFEDEDLEIVQEEHDFIPQ